MSDLKAQMSRSNLQVCKLRSGHQLLVLFTPLVDMFWPEVLCNLQVWGGNNLFLPVKLAVTMTFPLFSALVCTECWGKVKTLLLIFNTFPSLHTEYLEPFPKSWWKPSILTFRPSAASHLSVGKGLLSFSQPETHTDICVNIFFCCSTPVHQEAELSP